MKIELICDVDCPNVAATRSLLIKAYAQTGVSAKWKEWERGSPESPAYAQGFGSPTILVNGKDIAGISPTPGTRACRVYTGSGGTLQSTPPLELICAALLKGDSGTKHRIDGGGHWQTLVASFPAIGTALLPKLACPLCLPLYAALLSALGVEFFNYTPYLLPLTIAFLVVALGGLLIQANRTKQWIASIVGAVATAIVLLGKFTFELEWLTAVGIGLLVVAIIISMRRTSKAAVCSACTDEGSEAKAEIR